MEKVCHCGHGLPRAFQGEHLEDVPHIRPALKNTGNACGDQSILEPCRIGVEDLPLSHLNQSGRKPGQIAKQGRKARLAVIGVRGVSAANGLDERLVSMGSSSSRWV